MQIIPEIAANMLIIFPGIVIGISFPPYPTVAIVEMTKKIPGAELKWFVLFWRRFWAKIKILTKYYKIW